MAKRTVKRLKDKERKKRAVPIHQSLKTGDMEDLAEEMEIRINEEDWDDIVTMHRNRSTCYMSVKGLSRELFVPRNIIEKVIDKHHLPVRRTLKIRGEIKSLYRLKEFFTAYLNTDGVRQTHSEVGRPKKQRPQSKEDADLRFAVARADRAELELARVAGVVHLEEDVIKNVGDMLGAFRARVLGLSTKVATVVPPEFRSEVEAAAKKVIHEALTEIASYRPNGPPPVTGVVAEDHVVEGEAA